jgi:isopentenyl diphosphate isomerase/L-lactate dehydrogenase-like FMN-dependent dehydrogenase
MTPISSAGHLSRAVNIEDLRELARRRLPRIVFNYIDGGADGEWTLRENRRAFDAITFRPHQAVAVRAGDLRTRVLGAELSMPLLLAPVGYLRVMHPDGEIAAARAAGRAGVGFILSTVSSHRLPLHGYGLELKVHFGFRRWDSLTSAGRLGPRLWSLRL